MGPAGGFPATGSRAEPRRSAMIGWEAERSGMTDALRSVTKGDGRRSAQGARRRSDRRTAIAGGRQRTAAVWASEPLDDGGDAHASAHAEGNQTALERAPLKLVDEGA